MRFEECAKIALDGASSDERNELLEELSVQLTERLSAPSHFDAEVRAVIRDLRAVGHELYLFDQIVTFSFGAVIGPAHKTRHA